MNILDSLGNVYRQLSREMKLGILFLYLLVFLIPPLAISADAGSTSIIGGALGASVSMSVLLRIYMMPASAKHASYELLFWRTICDFGLALRFVSYHGWNQLVCGHSHCTITQNGDPTLGESSYQNNCALPSGILEFLEIAAEGWFLCLAFDLQKTISDPFSSFANRLKKYHMFTWTFGIIFGIALMSSPYLYGFWFISDYIDEDVFCWIKSWKNEQSAFSINFRPWVMFYIPLLCVYVFALRSLFRAYSRLAHGISKTFQHRISVLILNSINISIYILYWTYVLALYGFGNALDPHKLTAKVIYRLLIFSVAAKGFADGVVFVLIEDTTATIARAKIEAGIEGEGGREMDLNQALRMEVLYYATTGIRKTALKSSQSIHDPSVSTSVITMIQKGVEGENRVQLLTPQLFLRILIGYKDELVKLVRSTVDVRSAPTTSYLESQSMTVEQRYSMHMGNEHLNFDSVAVSPLVNDAPGEPAGIGMVDFGPNGSSEVGDHGNAHPRESEVAVSDYEEIMSGNKQGLNPKQIKNLVLFTEFCPFYFRQIRQCFGVNDAAYQSAFETTIKERLTEGGASGAFFFFSKGEKFIAKSCNAGEMNVLVSNCAKYATYLAKNPDSLITRIYGAYKLYIYGVDLYFFVMNNLLLTQGNEPLNEKYDLKGSWVARNATLPKDGQRVICTFCNQKFRFVKKSKRPRGSSRSVSIDSRASSGTNKTTPLSEDEEQTDKCPVTVHGHHEPNVIMKDNDLKYKLRLPNETALALYIQLRKDAYLLCSIGIMDYSLLLGVHNTEYEVEDLRSEGDYARAGKRVMKKAEKALSVNEDNDFVSKRFQVSRVVGPEAYYMGIIDFLQEWNLKKEMERFLKTKFQGADPEGLSAINPIVYRERFLRRMEELLDMDESQIILAKSSTVDELEPSEAESLLKRATSAKRNKMVEV